MYKRQWSVNKCYLVHVHMTGGDSSVCDFSLESALVPFVWVTVQIKALGIFARAVIMAAIIVYPEAII